MLELGLTSSNETRNPVSIAFAGPAAVVFAPRCFVVDPFSDSDP